MGTINDEHIAYYVSPTASGVWFVLREHLADALETTRGAAEIDRVRVDPEIRRYAIKNV